MQDTGVPSLRVALYARVSTEEQRDGQTIDSQISELDGFARHKGWPVVGVYKDDGWSGGLLARPALDRLRDDARKHLFDSVLINDVDRLARDVSHLGIVKRDLERAGIKLIFKKLPTESCPTHNLMVNILGSFAEFERELILDRTRRGRRHKVEVRKLFLGGPAPYGFRYIPRDKSANREGYLETVKEEVTIVRQMFDWVDKQGLSARGVVDRLSSMKVPPRKKGERWGKSSVLRILRSETYAGVWHYNKYEGCEPVKTTKTGKYRKSLKGSTRLRPKSEWLPVVLPEKLRLIERDQWLRVQEQINRNVTFSERNSKHDYLLKGLVRCGGCGARYVGDPCHGSYYYRCHARCKKVGTIKEQRLDDAVWSAIEEAILEPTLIVDQVDKLQAKQAVNEKQLKSEEDEIEGALAELQTEESRILEVYRTGIITPDQLGRELKEIRVRSNALETRRKAVAAPAHRPPPDLKRSIFDWCQIAAERLKQFTIQERQRFLRFVVSDIVFEGRRVRIKCIIPVPARREPHRFEDSFEEPNRPTGSSRIEAPASDCHSRNSEGAIWIENLASHTPARNSEAEVGFELAKFFPDPIPLKDKLTPAFLRRLIEHNPRGTLVEFCDELKIEHSVVASPTALCRAFKRAGLDSKARSRFKHTEKIPP